MATQSESTPSADRRRTFRKRLSINLGIAGLLAALAALVVAFAGSGAGVSATGSGAGGPAQPVYYPSSCSQPTSVSTVANAGYYYTPRTVTVTKTRVLYRTVTKTLYRTLTKTVCRTVTSTAPGQTITTTVTGPGSTTTVTEQGTTVTYVTTAPGSTVTETVTETASGTGTGTGSAFICPSSDNGGFSVGVTDYTSDPIFCSYPVTPDENPNDFFCTYSATTGALVTDNDAGFCPTTATPKP